MPSLILNRNIFQPAINERRQNIPFQIKIPGTRFENFVINGEYNRFSEKLTFNLSFKAMVNGQKYRFDLKFKAQVDITSFKSWGSAKEEISFFALDILREISRLQAEGKEIDGLILDKEDLKKLLRWDGGKFLRLILAVITFSKILNRLRQKQAQHVMLYAKRPELNFSYSTLNITENFEVSLKITKVQ